jgi:beta-N-acetylhexosaminidase
VLALALAATLAGHSAQGRPIEAVRQGTGPTHVLVVGDIHGTEPAGIAVVRALRSLRVPGSLSLWTVRSANPDGLRAGIRQNARGVDLNRNFPFRWSNGGRARWSTYYAGPAPASEPETRAMMALIRRVRPQVTVWYHQHLRLVTLEHGGDNGLIRAYARRVGLPARWIAYLRGTATSWQNHRVSPTAFVVELPAGPLSAASARVHARAVLAAGLRASASAAAPPIVQSRIPFGARRKREMRAYARRHYGIDDYRLVAPKVIVEHWTGSTTYASAFNTFATDAPDPELHELPGTCAHFVVDRDGTIHQLVSLSIMCRHTVGLNWTAIGVEHVGTSDAAVMGDARQLRASLRLTRWLQARFGIPTRDVIGHAESLSSPYHRERVARLRRQTHGDMAPATMRRYRSLL